VTESPADPLRVEATGETVGEAKWLALRELERIAPGVDKAAVEFEVLSEGERGLLGVGYAPARVAAVAERPPEAADGEPPRADTSLVGEVREVAERIAAGLGVTADVHVREGDESLLVAFEGDDLGLLIGRHGQTIDAIQYLVNAIVLQREEPDQKLVTVDAAGYRERRQSLLESLAARSAERARSLGQPVELEPMTALERRIVHLRLKDEPGVSTRSEGDEPHRYVVVEPA
jgi:spoIIIJ-associated protein